MQEGETHEKPVNGLILIPILSLAVLGGTAEAAPVQKPRPTHTPEATPYVRVFDGTTVYESEAEPMVFECIEESWAHFYTQFGRFYPRGEQLEMFRSLPPDEPYSFVPHSARFELDEGEDMRMARCFDALDGVDARVIARHELLEGLDTWGYLTVVTMTPARFFELSEEAGEPF